MWQSPQVSEWGSRLQRVTPGVGSHLGVAINHDSWHSRATALRAGAQQAADPGRLSFLPGEEWCRSKPQEYAGFGDSKKGHVPKIEILGHRPGEHEVWMETGVIDSFSTLALETGRPPFSFSSIKVAQNAFREQKPHRAIWSPYLVWLPGKDGTVLPREKTPENQGYRPLP